MSQINKNEIYKSFCNVRFVLVIALALVFEIVLALQMRTVMFDGYHKSVYQYYMNQIEGKYLPEKKVLVDNEYIRFCEYVENEDFYENEFKNNKLSADEYHEILDKQKTARYRIPTLEYIKQKADYFENNNKGYSFFYDTELSDYIKYLGLDLIQLIALMMIIIPIYTDDYYAGTTMLIRSTEKGKKKLFAVRMKMAITISCIVSMLFSIVEFVVRYISFDISNLNAKVGSLMLDANVCVKRFQNITIWQYIVTIFMVRLIAATVSGIVALVIGKQSKGNLQALIIAGIYVILINMLIRM